LETVIRAERRLAAVLAADVPGYSRLMGADEEGTHARLRSHLREFIEDAWIARRVDIANHWLARFPEA
jgi:class 3 adenylate cyclase